MANVIINDTNLLNIADAIRGKNGSNETYKPSEMAAAINSIPVGGGSSISVPELYTNAQGSSSGPLIYLNLDTTNATTLTLKYEYNTCGSSVPNAFTFRALLGWRMEVVSTSQRYTYNPVDDDYKTETIASAITTSVTDVEITLDVSKYTSVVLYTDFGAKSSSLAKARAHVYDIRLS